MKNEGLFDLLKKKGGYYQAAIDADGIALSRLVAGSSTYIDVDKKVKQYIGREYVNFAVVESDPEALLKFADALLEQLHAAELIMNGVVLLGIANGGIKLAGAMAQQLLRGGIKSSSPYVDKSGSVAPDSVHNERRSYMWRRHHLREGDKVVIIDDASNSNKSFTDVAGLVVMAKAHTIGVACAVSRKPATELTLHNGSTVPFFSGHEIDAPTWAHSHPMVAKALERKMVEYYPRDHWAALIAEQERVALLNVL